MTRSSPRSSSRLEPGQTVSVSLIRQLLELAAQWGVSTDALVETAGLRSAQLEDPDARVRGAQVIAVARGLALASGREDIGIAWAMLAKPTAHGYLGYAAMSADTVGDAMQMLQRYRVSHLSEFTQRVIVDARHVILRADEDVDLGPLRHAYFEAFLAMVCRLVMQLTGEALEDWRVDVDWDEPEYFGAYRQRLPLWRFGQPFNQVTIPRSFLQIPMLLADPLAVRRALGQLDREAAERTTDRAQDIVYRTRAHLQASAEGFPSLTELAMQLNLSERTLKRRLQRAGASFQGLLDDARHNRANELILAGALPMKEIASRIGYSDPAAFTRAYKRWSKHAPSELRKNIGSAH